MERLNMSKVDFQNMTKEDLDAYVRANPSDESALKFLTQRIKANGKIVTIEELEEILIKKKK
jgi:hypothetical protein